MREQTVKLIVFLWKLFPSLEWVEGSCWGHRLKMARSQPEAGAEPGKLFRSNYNFSTLERPFPGLYEHVTRWSQGASRWLICVSIIFSPFGHISLGRCLLPQEMERHSSSSPISLHTLPWSLPPLQVHLGSEIHQNPFHLFCSLTVSFDCKILLEGSFRGHPPGRKICSDFLLCRVLYPAMSLTLGT